MTTYFTPFSTALTEKFSVNYLPLLRKKIASPLDTEAASFSETLVTTYKNILFITEKITI
jgi:hypothetical protein